jgi:hypothetical protein
MQSAYIVELKYILNQSIQQNKQLMNMKDKK